MSTSFLEGTGPAIVISAVVNATASTVNGVLSRKHSEKLAQENRELQVSMERNRQNFQLRTLEINAQTQRELTDRNHELRLLEQKSNFENLCAQAEWNRFMSTWPLINVPSVIRNEQILPDNTVALRVIFSRNNDPTFTNYVFPVVEQGLREFTDMYHNRIGAQNIIFYHNSFVGPIAGGAVESNIHYALADLPVMIIDTNILADEICVSLTMWGFGREIPSHALLFRLKYGQAPKEGVSVSEYYKNIAYKLTAYLKFVIGYAYDVYDLVEYDRPPVLPLAMKYDSETGDRRGMMAGIQNIKQETAQRYGEMYAAVIGSPDEKQQASFAMLPENCKTGRLHTMRMEYAAAMREYLPEDVYIRCLDDSLEAWAALRTEDKPGRLLDDLAGGGKRISDYFTLKDKDHFFRLAGLYDAAGESSAGSAYAEKVRSICAKLGEPGSLPAGGQEAVPAVISVSTGSAGRDRKVYNV